MKKVVLSVMAMIMAVVMLTACGSDKTGDSGKKVYKVGVTQFTVSSFHRNKQYGQQQTQRAKNGNLIKATTTINPAC